jgi:lipoyl(octanoyl) transferase
VPEAADAVAPHLIELLEWESYVPRPDIDHAPALSVPIGSLR